MAVGDKKTIEDWHNLEKEIGVWGFSLERETIKKKGRLPIWFWRNYKVVRLMKKVRGFFRGKWDFSLEENKSQHLFFWEAWDHTWEGFLAHFWVRILGRGNTRINFFWEKTRTELRGSSRTLWTTNSTTHKSHIFERGISDTRKVSSPF